MGLEITTLNEVSHTKKVKYPMVYSHVKYNFKENEAIELIYQTETDSQTWKTNVVT